MEVSTNRNTGNWYFVFPLLILFFLSLGLVAQSNYEPHSTKEINHKIEAGDYPKLSVKLELLAGPGLVFEPTLIDNFTLSIGIGTRIAYYSKKNVNKSNTFVYNPKLFLEGRYYFMEWQHKDANYIRRIYDGAYVGLHLAASLDKDAFDENDNHVLFGIQKSFLKRLYVNLGVGVWAEKSKGTTQFYFLIPFGLGFILK